MKKRSIKGFTLAELLIVVAIIAVLVAIAIPIFNKQIEKSREAYDIATMRQAASLAVEYYYQGVEDDTSAQNAGLVWWTNDGKDQANAAGVYDPQSGGFLPKTSQNHGLKPYGKGTKKDGGTRYTLGNDRGAYSSTEEYTDAVVMVAIYPKGNKRHIDVYWKSTDGKYVGGQNGSTKNDPKYSIRINID